VTAFANETGDGPMLFAVLEILCREPGYFRPPEATTEQNCDDCLVMCCLDPHGRTRRVVRALGAAGSSIVKNR
jgi:hypothetical protein